MSDNPTFELIAKRSGVAKPTVSLALRNSPELLEKTRLRIQDVARELGYKPNPSELADPDILNPKLLTVILNRDPALFSEQLVFWAGVLEVYLLEGSFYVQNSNRCFYFSHYRC